MGSDPQTTFAPVVFQRSLIGRISLFGKALIGCLVLQGIVAGLVWGGLAGWYYGGRGHDWIHLLGAVLVLAMIPLTWALCNFRAPTLLIIHEDHMRIGGAIHKRNIRYDVVALLQLEELDEIATRSVRLVIKPRRGRRSNVVLLKVDAVACFHALREMCPQAAAIEFDEVAHTPVDDEHYVEGRNVLSQALLRKAVFYAVAAVTFAAVTVTVFVVMGGGVLLQQPFRALYNAGLPLLGSLAFTLQSYQCWKLRRSIRREVFTIVEM